MIVVTGLRSGTSLMMQTLKLLGVPVVGFLYHDDFPHKHLNPKGYYDLPINETIDGIDHSEHVGKAVKLYGLQLNRTDPKYINKVFYCDRGEEATIKSVQKLIDANKSILEDFGGESITAEQAYRENKTLIEHYLNSNPISYMHFMYEDMLKEPKAMIFLICKFLEIKPDIKNAVKNVNKECV